MAATSGGIKREVLERTSSSINNQFNNLNLNQNHKQIVINSFSKSNLSETNEASNLNAGVKNKMFEKTAALFKTGFSGFLVENNKKDSSWQKSHKSMDNLCQKTSKVLNFTDDVNSKDKKKWKMNDDKNSNAKNASTLSLHIAAYENSIEVAPESECISFHKNKKPLKCENSGIHCVPFEFPRSSSDEASEPEVMQFKASQKLLSFNSSKKSPILRAGAKRMASQSAYLNFAKQGRLENDPSTYPSSSARTPTAIASAEFDAPDDFSFFPSAAPCSLQDDDRLLLNRSCDSEFTTLDQQMIMFHNRLRSGESRSHYFQTQSVFELISGSHLPYSITIEKKLETDLKKIWTIDAHFYCSGCLSSLNSENVKCRNDLCKDKNKKNVVICTCDIRQPLLHIVKRFGDFSEYDDKDHVIFKVTVNTDGIVPKGHGQTELWPVFVQPANIPDHFKSMHDSVALLAVVFDNGKPSENAWSIALTPLVEWLHDQGEGIRLRVSATKEVNVFFEIENLSADLAGVCHLFHFASWASSSEACMLCKVKPIREHGAQRWDIVDNAVRRNNLNMTLDMLRRTGGFKEGASAFWMKLCNVLHYRFDSLHKICEGVCSTLLKEFFSTPRKMGNALKIQQLQDLENVIRNITWPQRTKIVFTKLSAGTAHEKLGSFLIAVPLALSCSNIKKEYIVWILGILSIIYSEFFVTTASRINKKTLLEQIARLQKLLFGSVFSTLKFHYFFVHLFDEEDPVKKVSTFVFESLNRYIKLKLHPNFQKGFTTAVLENYMLEQLVRIELQRRSEFCVEIKQYINQIDWRVKAKSGINIGDITLKGEKRTFNNQTFFDRALRHSKMFCTNDYNTTNSKVVFQHQDVARFGRILDIIRCGEHVSARIETFVTTSFRHSLDDFIHCDIEGSQNLAQEMSNDIFYLLDNHIQVEVDDADQIPDIINTDLNNILGHCLEVEFQEKKIYFNLAMKVDCK